MGVYNITFKKGEDYEQELLIRESSTHDPINISDYEFAADCRDNLKSGTVLFSFVFVKDPDTATGRVVMSVDRTITAGLIPSAGVYDVFVTYTSTGKREPFINGNVVFLTAVTEETP